jgi:hypothetical protein
MNYGALGGMKIDRGNRSTQRKPAPLCPPQIPLDKTRDLMAVVMKSFIFWDIAPCNPLKVNQCFGGIFYLYLQMSKNKSSKKQLLTFIGLHGVMSHKVELFITTYAPYLCLQTVIML